MASQSLINESIMNIEDALVELEDTTSVLENECTLETLVGQPGSIYDENVEMWREYSMILDKVIYTALELKKKLDYELAKK